MTMTDTILFVKETQTCHYVLHIATPRLCGEPGFKSRMDAREETFIRCREVVDAGEYESADRSLPSAAHPFKLPKRSKPVISPSPEDEGVASDGGAPDREQPKTTEDVFRRVLERFLARGGGQNDAQVVFEDDGEEGELLIELVDAEDFALGGDDGDTLTLNGDVLAEILRAAGYDIKGQRQEDTGSSSSSKDSRPARSNTQESPDSDDGEDAKAPLTQRRDEL